MTEQETLIYDRLVDKSIDAFTFAIEIINKPTLRHRSENFVFNMCNAWELMLKSQLVKDKGEDAIYYKKRTITLSNCIETIFTDFHNPVKNNLTIIEKLRNKSTHFITPEYDEIYISVFQANVVYYVEHLKRYFSIDLSTKFPSNFLTIAANPKPISDIKMLSKIDKATFNAFLKERKNIMALEGHDGVGVSFEVRLKSVKKNEDLTFRIDPNADLSAQVIKQVMDPSNSHPYRQKDIIALINKEIGDNTINQYSFRAIRYYENIEEFPEYYYFHKQSGSKTYSQKAVNLFLKNIKEQPNYIEIAIKEFKKK